MGVNFPGESAQYRAARDALLARETALRREIEAVAQARRALPLGGLVPEDYVFEGASGEIHLSELFGPGRDALVVYNFMFPRDPGDDRPGPKAGATAALALEEGPCPSCVALLDEMDGAARHVDPRLDMVVVAKAPFARLTALATERGWSRLRLLSSAGNRYNRDYRGETAVGHQRPMMNVFRRQDGEVRHFWGSELLYAPTDPGQDPRHVGTIETLWNMMDLTPHGRTGGDELLDYAGCCSMKA
jgi:predicted dithiol-disulfide oxidoreductase (DUF899 family)